MPRDAALTDVVVLCPSCDWTGTVRLYDIGDGPEWNCPSCDMCFPSNAVIGEDGLTNAERKLHELARQIQRERWGSSDGDEGEAGP